MTAPDHPGVLVVAALKAMDMTQAQLARRSGMTPKHINQVCQGCTGISVRLAVLLEEVTGVDALQWLHAQAVYDVAAARTRRRDELAAQGDERARAAAAVSKLLGGAS